MIGLDDDVGIGEDRGIGRRAEHGQHVRHVLRRGPADLDPAHDDLRGALEAVLEPSVIDVDHGRADAGAGMGRGDARAHEAGPQDADVIDGPRLDAGIAHARVARQPVLHEEDGDQVAQDRRADELADGLLLGLEALFERQVAALADGLERGERRGYCPFVFDLTSPSATAKANIISSWSRPSGWRSCSRRVFHSPVSWRYSIRRVPFLDQPIRRDGVEDQPDRRGLLGRDRLAGGDHLDGRIQADQPRQPLGAAPAGDQADLDLGQTDLRVRRCRGEAVVHRQDQLGPAAQAIAVDQGDGRERQLAEAVENLVAGSQGPGRLLGRDVGQRGQVVQVGAGDELPRLAAPEQQAAQVGPLRELTDQPRQLAEDAPGRVYSPSCRGGRR